MTIKRLQKKENILAAVQVGITLSAPLFLSLIIESELSHFFISGILGLTLISIIWIQFVRRKMNDKIAEFYENLETGVVLTKRLPMAHSQSFIVTQASPGYYHLKNTVDHRQIVVPRKRAREDFSVLDLN